MIRINKNTELSNQNVDPYDAANFTVGDILDASFHYSAKIPKFFKVIRRTPSMIHCIALSKKNVSSDAWGQYGECVPILDSDPENGKIYRGKITKHGVKIDGCSARIWSGKPVDFYTD